MKLPYFKFYPQDFLVGTALMSSAEVGLYIRLLCFQWTSPNHSLPADDASLMKIAYWEGPSIPESVRSKFTLVNGRLVNPRLQVELDKSNDYSASQSDKAHKRWDKPPEKPAKPPVAKADSEHHQFINLWCDRFKLTLGMAYVVDGGRDGKGAKAILSSSKMSPSELVTIAESAWRKPEDFNCKQAVTIHGFAGRFNDIRAALKNGSHGGKHIGTSTPADAEF